jgi:arabinogalactan endo-1,4-beta-galactosidase
LDYDIIGISYYPIWHGKSLTELELQLNNLSQTFEKEIVIAETAYPFTLDWNDWTTNIVGSENQIITPDFPANPTGQHDFILQINKLSTHNLERGIGFCYWGGELVSWYGNQATNGSAWENQALLDFNNKALPVLDAFERQSD